MELPKGRQRGQVKDILKQKLLEEKIRREYNKQDKKYSKNLGENKQQSA